MIPLPSIRKSVCSRCRWILSGRGFTLIELLVTMAFMAAVAVVAIPAISGMVNNYSGNRAVHEMVSDLNLVRTLAIRHGQNASVAFNTPAANQYTVSWGFPVQARVVDLTSFRGGVQFDNNPPAPPEPVTAAIVFTPQGLAEINPQGWGNIYLTDRDNSEDLCIEVTMAGAISEMTYNPGTNQWVYR